MRVLGTKSMRYRVGQTKGTLVAGEETPTVIDQGSVTVTTTRAVFVGSKQTREWAWAKLVSVEHDDPGMARHRSVEPSESLRRHLPDGRDPPAPRARRRPVRRCIQRHRR